LAATESTTEQQAGNESGQPFAGRQLALARSRAYGLLSQLYLTGVTSQNLAQVRAVPELAHKLARSFEADEAAADHQHLFGFNVHPYQSYFLDAAGLLGGPVTESLIQSYGRSGFQPELSAESADHIGFELGFLAYLCAAESEMLEIDVTRQIHERQFTFLHEHLLRWIGPLSLAIGQQKQPFYSAVTDVTLDLLEDHVAGLVSYDGRPVKEAITTAETPDLLANEETGLKQIADFLLTPVYSGIYLSRDDIGRLARRQAVPRGFGDRRVLLLNLLRSAANYDALGEIINDLGGLAGRWEAAYAEMAERPGMGVYMTSWQGRANGTVDMLAQMGSRVEALV
jgi:TorA maturation chaperone TorD